MNKKQKIDLVRYNDGTWSLREHGSDFDLEDEGEPLFFATDSEARQHATDSGFVIVQYDS